MATHKILVFGASYGSLLGTKLALAGHSATLVCRARTADLINERGTTVRMPVKGREGLVAVESKRLAGRVDATTPDAAQPADYDLIVLAMQEPQYRLPGVRELVQKAARSGVPCLSLMNMPPLPYLQRIEGISAIDCLESYTDASVWDGFDPSLITLCSPDAQAFRPPEEDGNVLQVRLPTNFKAARFESDVHTAMLREIAAGIEAARFGFTRVELPVKLKVHESVFVPLAKWSMLLAGNYRCVGAESMSSIRDAVHSDVAATRAVYDTVAQLCRSLGASDADLVPFDKYAEAARSLGSPSSAARALAAGATNIERVDRLVQTLLAQQGMHSAEVDAIVARVNGWLATNRRKAA